MTALPEYSNSGEFKLEDYKHLLPADPLTTHSPPEGKTHEEVSSEKKEFKARLTGFANQIGYEGTSKELMHAAIDLMNLFHFNQYRGGSDRLHYTDHTSKVALGAAKAAHQQSQKQDVDIIKTHQGETLPPDVVAFVAGALHDSIEDFRVSMKSAAPELDQNTCAQIVRAKIAEKFDPIIGPEARQKIVDVIEILTSTNTEEIPTSSYVSGIVENFYARCVKQADYDHNLQTFPDFSPAYPLLVVPSQYLQVVEGTSFEDRYGEHLIINLARFSKDEIIPWDKERRERGITTVEHVLSLLEKYEGAAAYSKIKTYFECLSDKISSGHFDSCLTDIGLSRENALDKIAELQELLVSPLPEFLRETVETATGVIKPQTSEHLVKQFPLRILGPMASWGGKVHFPSNDLEGVKEGIRSTSERTRRPIPGYICQEDGNQSSFHISRYPRRAEEDVRALDHYELILEEIRKTLQSQGTDAKAVVEENTDPKVRIVLGLEEGYFDGKRREVVGLIDNQTISNLGELQKALEQFLGDYEGLGIYLGSNPTFESACNVVRDSSLSVLHTVDEVKQFLGEEFEIEPASIFSVKPEYAAPYQEPGAKIIAPATGEHFEKLLALADRFKQARFTVERLDTGLVVNVELQRFSQEVSAALI